MRQQAVGDRELLQRISQDDESALELLLSRYYTPLGSFAQSLLRRRDLADEAVSNVFLSIWRRRKTLSVRTKVRAYLFAAVGNQSFNLRRSELPKGMVFLDDSLTQDLVDERRVDEALLYQEFQQQVNLLLEKMPPQRQLIFRLNRIEGRRYSEIAETLGLAESTVQNHMVQAVKQLAPELPTFQRAMQRANKGS
ncbi:MAG: sigma-70 family RNA polymerase sigma factor [Opitutaceae bacterium]|nr:sigma-70 family RNA polymerase sigma factor [Opitutaceae bacterium]